MRGYLQGHLKMYPTAISLILENITKIVLYLFLIRSVDVTNIITLVFILYFLSYLVSMLILYICIKKYKKLEDLLPVFYFIKSKSPLITIGENPVISSLPKVKAGCV